MMRCSLLFLCLASGVLAAKQRSQDSSSSERVTVVYAVNPTSAPKSSNIVPVYPSFQQPPAALTPPPLVRVPQYPSVQIKSQNEDSKFRPNKEEYEDKPQRPTFTDWNFRPNDRGTAGSNPDVKFKPLFPGTTHVQGIASSYQPDKIQETFAQPSSNVGADVSKGVARLALSLDSVLPQWDNRLFSPASIGSALSLLLLGSRGKTGQEIANLLGVKDGPTLDRTEELHRELGKLYGKLSTGEDFIGTQLLVACGLFTQKGITVKPRYIQMARELYKSEVHPLDFRQRGQDSRNYINQWVESKTGGRIPMLLSEPLDPQTSMVIVNALYFNGEWKYPFISQATGMRDFYPSESEVIKVPMMVNAAEAYYFHDKQRSLQVLGIPYKGDDVIMYIFLPQENLQKFISTLTPNSIHELINSTKLHQTIIYSVPKMKLESELKLRWPLDKLGVKSVFTPWAMLSDIGAGVSVSEVFHKVEIEVTEAGTVGSAATSVTLSRDGGTPMVRVERPFVFFIYHAPTSSIIFWGSVLKPRPFST